MKAEQEIMKNLLVDTVSSLCKNGLTFRKALKVQGLLGITVDDNEVFIVHLNEQFASTIAGLIAPADAKDGANLQNSGNLNQVDISSDSDEEFDESNGCIRNVSYEGEIIGKNQDTYNHINFDQDNFDREIGGQSGRSFQQGGMKVNKSLNYTDCDTKTGICNNVAAPVQGRVDDPVSILPEDATGICKIERVCSERIDNCNMDSSSDNDPGGKIPSNFPVLGLSESTSSRLQLESSHNNRLSNRIGGHRYSLQDNDSIDPQNFNFSQSVFPDMYQNAIATSSGSGPSIYDDEMNKYKKSSFYPNKSRHRRRQPRRPRDSDEKRFICPLCGFSYYHKTHLNYHLSKKHDVTRTH